MTPGIWLHCANNSLATPQNRFLNPYLVRYGWRAFLQPTIDLVRRFRVETMFLVNPLGDECRAWRSSGEWPTRAELAAHGDVLKRQSFHAYRECVAQGMPETVMNVEELRGCIAELETAGCRVIPYLGPWLRGQANASNVRSELEWLFGEDGCVCYSVCEDGSGSRFSQMGSSLRANGIDFVIEPMAQRATNDGIPIDPSARDIPSLTLETTLANPDGFYPFDEYNGTRWWVDDVNRGYGDAFWRLAGKRIGQGFIPCIEPRAEVFSVWDEMIVANPS